MLQCIANDVVERPVQQLGFSEELILSHREIAQLDMASAFGSLEAGVFHNIGKQCAQGKTLSGGMRHPGLKARQGEHLANQTIQASGFMLDTVKVGCNLAGLLTCQFDRDTQSGQRRAQFMGNIMQQAFLCVDESFQLVGHTVEISTKVPDLIVMPPHQGVYSGIQAPLLDLTQCPAQIANRTGEIPGRQGTKG